MTKHYGQNYFTTPSFHAPTNCHSLAFLLFESVRATYQTDVGEISYAEFFIKNFRIKTIVIK